MSRSTLGHDRGLTLGAWDLEGILLEFEVFNLDLCLVITNIALLEFFTSTLANVFDPNRYFLITSTSKGTYT